MKKGVTFLSIFVLIAASFLLSCDGGGPVTLRINTWENPATTAVLQELNKAFMEMYPDITVELTTSPTDKFQQENPLRIQAADVDIWAGFGFAQKLQSFHTGDVQLAAAYQDIEAGNVLALDGQGFLKNYKSDAVKDAMTYNGKVYGVCMGSVGIAGIFWNRDIFAKYNLSQPTTYDELIEVCETLKKNGVTPFTAAGAAVWPVDMENLGFIGSIFGDSNDLEKSLWTGGKGFMEPKYIEALEKYQRLLLNYYETGFQTIEYNPHIQRFVDGKAAMLMDGLWQATSIASAGGDSFNFGYMQVPGSDNAADNQAYYGKYDLMWFVHAKTAAKDAALKWLDFLSRKDNYTKFANATGFIPTQDVAVSNKTLDEVSKFPMKISFEQIHISRPGQGEMAGGQIHYLTPMGTIASAEEFAKQAQAAWEAAGK